MSKLKEKYNFNSEKHQRDAPKPIWEASVEEIRERARKKLNNTDNEIEIDDCILSVYVSCREKDRPTGNLLAALTRKPYTTTLLPITYYSLDDYEREAIAYCFIEFTADFGPFRKGDTFESLHLSMHGSLLAFPYGEGSDSINCDVSLCVQ